MRFFPLFLCLLLSPISHALSLRADSPPRYVVQPGDSLWSISSRYLKNPWEWKELWRANPNIKNPNKLYAGAILVLDYYQNTPYIRVLSNGTIKLSPRVRAVQYEKPIPPVPLVDIQPFLNESLILDEDILGLAPYVVAFMGREHMQGGQGNEVYVKGLHPSPEMPPGERIAYSLFRSGKNYIDPLTNEILGFKANLVGYGELVAGGEPATVLLTSVNVGIQKEDKVLINDAPEFDFSFFPQAPAVPVRGLIIDMPDGMPTGNVQEALGGVVVLSIGANAGIAPGDILGIYGKIRIVKDPKDLLIPIKLPPERIGEAMVFRTFSKTSFALIVRANRAVYLLDSVTNP